MMMFMIMVMMMVMMDGYYDEFDHGDECNKDNDYDL
jgi:hypothetical protein